MIMVKLKIKKGESYYMYLLGKECGGEWRVEMGVEWLRWGWGYGDTEGTSYGGAVRWNGMEWNEQG